jgi:LPS export ABC transporter permease LptG
MLTGGWGTILCKGLAQIPMAVRRRARLIGWVLTLVDRYILREWLKMLGLILGAAVGLLLIQDMYGSFRDLLDYRADARQILLYYAVLAPSLLPEALPISVLVSLLYSLGAMRRDHEITALRAAGLSMGRITRWIWIGGAVLSALLLTLNARLIPWSVEQSRQLWDNLEFAAQAREAEASEVGLVYGLAFDNRLEGRMWFVNRFSQYDHRAFGITVSELDRNRREVRRVMASEGHYDEVDRVWVLANGRETTLDEEGDILRTIAFERRVYPQFRDDPRFMLLLAQRPKDLSLFELREAMNTLAVQGNPRAVAYRTRYHGVMATSLSCIIVVGLAIPFAMAGVRVNPAVGASKSLGLFFGFYLFMTIAITMGERGLLSPVLAAWAPNLGMLALALWLFRRLR